MTSPQPTVELRLPTQQTLDKYGLELAEWIAFIAVVDGQYVCFICGLPPKTGRFVVDHEHVRGWAAMPAARRKRYVRGVICTTCNHYILTRYGTPDRFRQAALYLERYAERKAAWLREAKARAST